MAFQGLNLTRLSTHLQEVLTSQTGDRLSTGTHDLTRNHVREGHYFASVLGRYD
jgi:hypothetical protein